MASLKFSTPVDMYESKSSQFFGNSDKWLDHSLFSCGYLSESIHYTIKDKKVEGTSQIVGYNGCFVNFRPERLSKYFVSGHPFSSFPGQLKRVGECNIGLVRRLKYIKISELDDPNSFSLASELVDNFETARFDNAVRKSVDALAGESLILKNPITGLEENVMDQKKLVRNSDKKLQKHFPNAKRAIQGNVSRRGSGRSKPSSPCNQNDGKSVSHPDNKLEVMLSNIGPHSSVDHCNYALRLLEQSNDTKMLNFFRWMKTNGKLIGNMSAYNLALRVLSRKQEWGDAEALLREMSTYPNCVLNCQVFNTLIYACYKRGLTDWGTKWFRMMLENGVKPNLATFGMLMSLYQKGSSLIEAKFTFAKMRSFKINCHTAYSAMITIYTRLGIYDKAEEIIEIMKEDIVCPNLENWLVQLNAYSQQGKLVEAEFVLKSMKEAGIPPNIVAYNTLIMGYGRAANMEAAQSLFKNLQDIGLEADESTYRSMVEGFGRVNKYKEAIWYYKELKRAGFHPNSSNFYTVINLQAKHKDEEGAIETLKDMREMGCQLPSILSSLLQAYERVDRLDKVPLILKASFYGTVLLDQTACSILVLAYMQHCLLDDALQVLCDKRWKDPVFEDNLYHLLICSCKEAGCYENAIKIFTQMPKNESNPNLHITCSMIDIYTIIGQFSEAENLYRKLKASEITLDMIAYSIVVRMYIKSGSLKDACLVLDIMEKQKDIIPDTFLFRDMLRIYQRCRMLDKLADVYYRILKSGVAWDEAMYNCIINCCGHALPVDELSRLFKEMLQSGFSPNTITFNVMIDLYARAGLYKKARKVLWLSRKQGLTDVISYNTIIAAYGKSKDFRNMKSAVRLMKYAGFSVSLEAYNSMLDAYGKADLLVEFRDVLQKMKEASCVSDHYTYNIMINIYGKKGWIEEVSSVLAELKEYGLEPDLWSYNTLIKAYGIAGMVEEAVNVVKEMRENGIEPDQITYVNLIGALQKNDDFLEAVKWSLWMKQTGLTSSKS